MSRPQENVEESPEDILKILEERERFLDEEEQERANRRPVIFKVDPFFKEVEAISPFVPRVISLGLFERDKWNKSPETTVRKESLKLDVAIKFLADIGKDLRSGWMEVSQEIVKEPMKMKNLYDEPSHRRSEDESKESEFIQSVLALDAIFVTSFLIHIGASFTFVPDKYKRIHEDLENKLKQTVNIISRESQKFVNALYGDIFKLENQIPLELLRNTIQIICASGQDSQVETQKDNADEIFQMFCRNVVVSIGLSCLPSIRLQNIIKGGSPGFQNCGHLLHCVAHALWAESRPIRNGHDKRVFTVGKRNDNQSGNDVDHDKQLFTVGKRNDIHSGNDAGSTCVQLEDNIDGDVKDYFEKCNPTLVTATELHKCGITFKAQDEFFPRLVPERVSWWRATLYLPQIEILHEYTAQYWRNFIAFEGSYVDSNFHPEKSFLQYLTFMNELINTKDDVQLFCSGRNPIIRNNQLGDHETVADLFNSLTSRQNNTMGPEWTSIRKEIMDYHNSNIRVKIGEFTDTYFGRPWLVISLVVASLLVILSVVQSVFSILKYVSDDD